MKLTATIYPYEAKGKKSNLLAFATITLDDCFVVKSLKVMDGSKGMFVAMPSEAYEEDGKTVWKDTAFPITAEFREEINEVVLEAYDKKINEKPAKKSRR